MTQKKDTPPTRKEPSGDIPTGVSQSTRGTLWLLLTVIILGGALWIARQQNGEPAPAKTAQAALEAPEKELTTEDYTPNVTKAEQEVTSESQPREHDGDFALAEINEKQEIAKRVRLALRHDITALEEKTTKQAARIEELTKQIEALTAAQSTASAAPTVTVDTQATAQTQAQLTELQIKFDAMQSDYAARDARLTQRLQLASLLEDIGAKLRSGEPYANEIKAFEPQAVASGLDAQAIATLAAQAEKGIPTLAALIDGFSEQVDAAVPESLLNQENPGFGDAVRSRLAHIVNIRRVDVESTDDSDEAHIARAESELLAGNVEMTLTHLEQLSPNVGKLFDDWSRQAKTHLATQNALERLKAALAQGGAQ